MSSAPPHLDHPCVIKRDVEDTGRCFVTGVQNG
jgi:hypothetical protein